MCDYVIEDSNPLAGQEGDELRTYRLVSKCFHFFPLLAQSRFSHTLIKCFTVQHIYYDTNWKFPSIPTTCHIIPYNNLNIISAELEGVC